MGRGRHSLQRSLLTGAVLVAALGGAGCTDYLARRDTLTLGTGEASQANMAVHVIDPSPPGSNRIVSDFNGERLQHGIERYRNPQAGLSGNGGIVPIPIGAASTGNPLGR